MNILHCYGLYLCPPKPPNGDFGEWLDQGFVILDEFTDEFSIVLGADDGSIEEETPTLGVSGNNQKAHSLDGIKRERKVCPLLTAVL